MSSVANHALSCPSYGALMHGDSPSTGKLWQRGGLLALKRSRQRRVGVRAGYTLLDSSPRVDLEGIVAEKPGLLALSSDLDWQRSVSELRQQALVGLHAHREMALARLFAYLDACLHDLLVERVLQPSLLLHRVRDPQDELGVRIRVQDLRWQATLQATEELANKVDSSFDWESEVAELHQCLAIQNRAELEQKLLSSWESSREGMDNEADRLHDEALKTTHTDDAHLTLFPDETPVVEEEKSSSMAFEISGTWWTLGILAGLFGAQTMSAIAADESVTAAVTAASKEAPGWVAPSVLAFPVVSYFLFTLYRDKVNPYAKLTDWVFGLVAMAIVGNIVLIATVGVRLY